LRLIRWGAVLVVSFVVTTWLAPGFTLAPLGRYLVDIAPPQPADCILVLAGDMRGQRILAAGEIYRKGLAKKVFVSGPAGLFNFTEDELAIPYAKRMGYADVPFAGIPMTANSTATEGRQALPRLRQEGCRSMLVVTSDFHTRRAGRTLRAEWPDMEVRMHAAPSDDFNPDKWWTARQYQKTFYVEWSKTFANWIGL